jgi:hypothetical protein
VFYTYAHYTPEGRLFYIGKGQGRRAHSKHRINKHWHSIVAKYGQPKVEILANWDTEEEAFSHEILLINCFRDMGYKLCNLTDGGEGATGRKISDEHKAKISAKLKGRVGVIPSDETRKKQSLAHMGQVSYRKGVFGVYKQSKETIAKRSVKLMGNTFKGLYRYIGTNLITGEKISFVGNKQIKHAGFEVSCVRKCADGDIYRKSHRGYSWAKENIKE